MEKYHRQISFKTLYLVFARRIIDVLFLFIPSACIVVIASQVIIKKEYYSQVSLDHYASVIKTEEYNKVVKYATSAYTIQTAADLLKNDGILHYDGTYITETDIRSGLSFEPLEANSIYITYKFTSSDQTITKSVLAKVTEVTLDSVKDGFKIAKEVSDPVKSNKNRNILIAGLAGCLALSLVLGFVSEIILDEVYDKADIESLGSYTFEVSIPKMGKENK